MVVSYEPTQEVTSSKKGKKGRGGMPPGLAIKDKLPPDLAKQLQENGSLPPGLAKRNLPSDVEKQLPLVPEGYKRQIVEDAAVVLVYKATGKIIDTVLGKLLD